MGGGLRRTMNFAPAQYANILFMWGGIKQTTVPTVAQKWTEWSEVWLIDANRLYDAAEAWNRRVNDG